ncbi:hypothetical protein ZEAMMB73_Zm00001d015545 [Zea mays]|uniref:Uncharacterized protein n=1 Tax=Zea mays TaxID=4577 RepID=A0A1D6H2N9_MAIZE|nr:hypothetical protein ZEAMMB73_Zm00001d015545 [Zea mays]
MSKDHKPTYDAELQRHQRWLPQHTVYDLGFGGLGHETTSRLTIASYC